MEASSCHRHMKAALHALDQLNALAWEQPLQEGFSSVLLHDRLKANALDELQSSLSMPDQISLDLARPLLASAVDEVRLIMKQAIMGCPGHVVVHMGVVRTSIDKRSSMQFSCQFACQFC